MHLFGYYFMGVGEGGERRRKDGLKTPLYLRQGAGIILQASDLAEKEESGGRGGEGEDGGEKDHPPSFWNDEGEKEKKEASMPAGGQTLLSSSLSEERLGV